MRLRYGMRLGRGLWVSGGPGIFVVFGFVWMLAAAFVTTIMIGFVIVCAIVFVIKTLSEYRKLRKKREDDVALFQRIATQQVKHVEFLSAGRTDPPALWGVYSIEPSYGPSYVKCGQHPGTLRKLWLENRCGTVRELMVLPDKPMAVALLQLLQRGVCSVKSNAAKACTGFAANGMPIVRDVQTTTQGQF